MSTDAMMGLAKSRQVLRVALGAPLVYWAALQLSVPLPFVAAMLYATLALKMAAPPPFRMAVLLTGLLLLLPALLGQVSGLLLEYPYMLIGCIGLALFHAFRLQMDPKTAPLGTLLQTFTILTPMLADASERIVGAFPLLLAVNAGLALAGLYLAFALFPAPPQPQAGATPPEPALPPARRTFEAGVAATVMLPLVALFLALDLTSAMRVLFTAALVLTATGPEGQRQAGLTAVLGVAVAGAAATGIAAFYLIWPTLIPALLALALLGLLIAPFALTGRITAAVSSAIPATWILLGSAGDHAIEQTLTWSFYAMAGTAWAVGARALLVSLLGGLRPAVRRPLPAAPAPPARPPWPGPTAQAGSDRR